MGIKNKNNRKLPTVKIKPIKKMANAAAPALPARTLDLITSRATSQFNEWKTSLTDEQKVAEMEKIRNLWNGPNFNAEFMAKQAQLFNEADANQDGKLNLAEYKVWEGKMRDQARENGTWFEADDHTEENYNVCNSIGDGDGFTHAELLQIMGAWMPIFESLKVTNSQ